MTNDAGDKAHDAKSARDARLKAALRDNLKRRKSQARGRAGASIVTPEDDATVVKRPRVRSAMVAWSQLSTTSTASSQVRAVVTALSPRHAFAYTTVMTLLERLVKRGHLTRRKSGRSFVYVPAREPDELREIAVEELVRNYFGESRDGLRKWLDGVPRKDALDESGSNDPIDTALL